ncbi:hypothetical protein HL033_04015 [Neoehrlichia mikurensis]|uniref:Uncharacterized protein n=1 Tax=Neoehrlichia mikurensis TaxID=89586 RepID=A0A9Q9BZB7_9RICK|nr:hypothetical protein [Neoehrlichia mikurensis]QXK91890.1 hypothetical protein IAH97_04010 [Neoehrlichia mikurensis]QXK93103.1 hypothetical protein HUN61_04005 [Neoehrlichia mikurensis]QXK93583.1 hypothetical protein HL033_04015 [Neoehrlichia mikurensis]UTO55464.1 hypothetical protein LUA82_04865 [Neoehrlichia mikurensis]UTO56384.1 hypothetical protein LUA81_04810 [Neoehrlichia mikurensis]
MPLSNNTENLLSECAPILMFWMVKNPSKLYANQLPLPNNKNYPYKQRLLNWATKEPQRKIKFYYISIGLSAEQISLLHDLSDPNKGGKDNIEVIDFIKKFSHKYDITYLYNKEIILTWKTDISRLIMLMEDSPALYFDFDILPKSEKIGNIIVNNDIGFVLGRYDPGYYNDEWLDISVIASTVKNNPNILAAYNAVNHIYYHVIQKLPNYQTFTEINMAVSLVWTAFISIPVFTCNKLQHCNQVIAQLQESNESLCNKIINILKTKENRKSIESIYKDKNNNEVITQKLCAHGAFTITRDFTWITELNNKDYIYITERSNNVKKFTTHLNLHVNTKSQIIPK